MLEYTPISQKQITDFDQNGYLIVRDVLDDKTIRKLVQVSDRLINSNLQINRRTKQLDDSFRNTVTLDKEYLSLITHPIILPLVIQLLGSSLHSCSKKVKAYILMVLHLLVTTANTNWTDARIESE